MFSKPVISLQFFSLPDCLEDIFPMLDMEKELGNKKAKDVYDSIKSINELVRYDKENDMAEFIDGGFSSQVLGMSLKIIVDNTESKPEYARMVVKMFFLDDCWLLDIPEELKPCYD